MYCFSFQLTSSDGGTRKARLEVNRLKAPNRPKSLGRKCEKRCVLRKDNPTVFLSLPEWLLVPCRSLHIQRLLGGPRLEVAGWWVAVTVRASCTGRPRHSRLSMNTRRSPLPVATILTVSGIAWLTCDDRSYFRMLVARFEGHLLTRVSIIPFTNWV